MLTILEHLATYPLMHTGDCKLLGVTPDDKVFVEELYSDEDWLAQHEIHVGQGVVETVDEDYGDNEGTALLTLPTQIIKPSSRSCCSSLAFTGARFRGILADERIDELVISLTVDEKIELVDFMEWEVDPFQLIGIAESVVLAHTVVTNDTLIVCRRVRVAYRLNELVEEASGVYDYDSLTLHCLHEFKPADVETPKIIDCLNDIEDVVLLRPMDCLFHANRLYVADGGEDEDVSAVHIFRIPNTVEVE